MAASADELLKNDNFQIPLIDLQRFCQDELNAAARLFGGFQETKFSSMVSPKIDKSIFNESAGSRRQTYSGDRVSRRRKKPIVNSHAKEFTQEISMNSLVNFSSSKGKLGINKNSSKNILDLVGKFLYILNKEEKNRLSVRSSLSSHASEERDFEKSFENAEGLDEDKSKVVDNAHSDILNARKTPQVSKVDSELMGGMGRIRMLSEGLERSQEDQNKVAVNSNLSIAESGNAYEEVLGRDTEGGIWASGDENIDTQHGLQVQSQERQLYEQVQASLKDFDRLVESETSELQNRGKVYEKQSQVDTICAELHRYILNAEGDINTVADGMDRPKRKCGRRKKKTTGWGSALSIDTKKGEYQKELAPQAGEHLSSDSRKRVWSGSPSSASKEYGGDHFSSDLRKRVHNGLSRGTSKDDNDLGVDRQFCHRKFSSEATTLDVKEVSSDASVAGDIIAKPTGSDIDRATNEKCKVDLTERANVAAEAFNRKQLYGAKLKKENMANRKNERCMLRQMSCMKKQKILPADDFLESWKRSLPNGWKVEVGLQRTESGKYDYYHKFVSPSGVQFPELKETSKYESSVCRQENDVKGSPGTNEIEFCNIYPAGYRGSSQRIDISHEEEKIEELNTSSKLDSLESMSIPSGSDGTRAEGHIYVCKLCGKNFNCYHHYVDHVVANAPTSHRKRGIPRLRGKVQNVSLPEKKEDKDDQIISTERDACEKIDELPRCGDKTQTGVHYSADTDCCYAMLSAGTPVLVNTIGAKRKPGQPREIKEPICSNDNHDDERNCTSNDRDEANDSFWSYKDVKENLSMCKQSAGLQTSIDRDACEKKDGLPRYGHKNQDEVHSENSIESVGVLALLDKDGQNNWSGQQRLREDSEDTTGDVASADPSLKMNEWSRLKDEMQVKDMDCSNDRQPLGAQVLVTQVGEKKKLGWLRKFQVPICSDSKLDDKINNYSSSCNQDEERHCQCDDKKDEMRISLDEELNFSKIDQSMHVKAPVFLDRSENFIGMQKLGKISQDEEIPCDKTIQHVGLVTNLDPDEQNKWFEQPRVEDDRQDVEPNYDRTNQPADSKNPVDSTSQLLEDINLDSTLQEHAIYQNSSKTTEDCFAEAGTLFPAVNIEKLDPNKIATGANAQMPFVDDEIDWDPSQFVVCQWCAQDFDFSSVSHLGSPCSWICPGCKTVNNGSSL